MRLLDHEIGTLRVRPRPLGPPERWGKTVATRLDQIFFI